MSIDLLAVKLGGALPTTSTRVSGSGSELAIDVQTGPVTTAVPADALVATAADLALALDTGPVSLDSAFAQLLELSEQQYEASEGALGGAAAQVAASFLEDAPAEADAAMSDAEAAAAAAMAAPGGLSENVPTGSLTPAGAAESLGQRRVLLVQQPVLRSAQLSTAAAGVETGVGASLPGRMDLASVFEMPVAPSMAANVELGLTAQVAPAATPPSAAQPAAPTASTALADAVLSADDPAFPEELAARVSWMLERGQEQATLRLDPPRLGSMTIQIALSDEVARVQILLTSPLAREAVDNSLLQLRQLFADAGLSLADVNVSGGGGQGSSEKSPHNSLAALRADDEAAEVVSTRVRGGSSMIDTFA